MSRTETDDWVPRLESEADQLYAFVRMVAGAREAAEDLFQETCYEAWRARRKFRENEDLGSWLRGIARHVCRRRGRLARRSASAPLSPEVIDRLEDTWSKLPPRQFEGERLAALRSCLGELNENHRQWIVLRYEQGLAIAEVAGRLGRSESAGKMLLGRLRSRLAECVERKTTESSGTRR
ncbi:MAG: sigma-70 family RNA polymerase sigma factor [Planctomycetes bacterium]|nr:sigma-70 family RNA polymerase sigma factor [Planctomycetota bacterium]